MAELDLDALEQAARGAGGGCWFSTGWTVGSRGFEVGDLKSRDRICSDAAERCAEFIAAANPAVISELLDRLEAAEKERDALRAKITEMEKQEPVAWMLNCQTLGGDTGWILSWTQSGAGLCNRLQGEENEKRLGVLPGAKGE